MKFSLVILSALIMSGCKEFHVINVSKVRQSLVFSNEMIVSACTKSIYIYDFEVMYSDGDVSSTGWGLVRDAQPDLEYSRFDLPLVYGDSLASVSTVDKAMDLVPGVYKLGATIYCLTADNTRSFSLVGVFAIDEDGGLITDQEKISRIENKGP
ncbi:hypothetical protein A9Q89_10515 [Gammaproteobacteria bacterium 53_120_T64]|nr:hypothetical protein A9Q89_10515 [Gammaproteobacteria bacterium 53_120_T64]